MRLLLAICLLETFCAAGEPHWAFRPLASPALPRVAQESWPRCAIDCFVLARLEESGIGPSPEADRLTLIRRLSFDLHGLPPAYEDIEAFVGDPDPQAYERLVDRWLASPRYGERWGRHWLDVVRFAETNGFEMNQPRDNAWPYRDYVIRSFNEDRPYDRFVAEQIAGDALGEDAATGFLVGGAWDQVKSPDPKLTRDQRMDELHDMVSTTGSAFLGLTVGCARCHDHKFDPILQRDYYGLQAVFAGVQHGEREITVPGSPEREARRRAVQAELDQVEARLADLEPFATPHPIPGSAPARLAVNPGGNTERLEPIEASVVRFTVFRTTDVEPCIDELEVFSSGAGRRNVALASLGAKARASSTYAGSDLHKLEHLNDGRHGNSRSWISAEPGRGWVEVELAEKTLIDRVSWARDREGQFKDRLATDYKIEVAREPGGEWTLVASSADRAPFRTGTAEPTPLVPPSVPEKAIEARKLADHRAKLEAEVSRLAARPRIYAGTFAQPGETRVLFRGDSSQPRDPVEPSAIAALGSPIALSAGAPERDRRLALARWITGPASSLTARVIVNRIWQHHFGEGIVSTPSDFGANGGKATHPELLDWLASKLVANGWSLKSIHREILLSSAYRQSSSPSDVGLSADAQSRLIWRFPPRRLEAEAIRDAVLFVSGKLDLAMGGPGFSPFEPNENYVRVYDPKKRFGPGDWRRMVYQKKIRSQQDGTFGCFDCPDGGQVCPRRTRSTTPLQSLSLLNSSFMLEQAGFLAERLARDAGGEPLEQVRRAFRLVCGRNPSQDESEGALGLVREHGLAVFCRAILNANEFLFIP